MRTCYPAAQVDCATCLVDVPGAECWGAGCGHVFCRPCWRKYLAERLVCACVWGGGGGTGGGSARACAASVLRVVAWALGVHTRGRRDHVTGGTRALGSRSVTAPRCSRAPACTSGMHLSCAARANWGMHLSFGARGLGYAFVVLWHANGVCISRIARELGYTFPVWQVPGASNG